MAFQIRPALQADIPAIAKIDFTTNIDKPLGFPWPTPEDGLKVFTSRFEHIFTQRIFHFLVAENNTGEVLGFLAWKEPGEEDEWQPDFPPGTKVEFLGWYLGAIAEGVKDLGLGGFHEIQSLAIAPEYQRRGIGTALLNSFVDILDKEKKECYLRGSVEGVELYKRFGWKVMGIHRPALKDWGYEKEYMSYHMKRERMGVQ